MLSVSDRDELITRFVRGFNEEIFWEQNESITNSHRKKVKTPRGLQVALDADMPYLTPMFIRHPPRSISCIFVSHG